MRVSGAALPFTRMFYGRPSEQLWEMDSGEVHRIPQGEGGERARPILATTDTGHGQFLAFSRLRRGGKGEEREGGAWVRARRVVRARNFELFFPLPPLFVSFSLSGCLLVEFLVVFWSAATLKCARFRPRVVV